jgi:penicillin-insensitive murein endopeptidase
MPPIRFVFGLMLLTAPVHAHPGAGTHDPGGGPARAIGETHNGCIAGAATLPTEGEGYVVMHLERRRYFGHPTLVDAITTLGRRAADGIGLLHVGDLSMARGGPMPFGHKSHQTGLDADVWFDLDPTLHTRADRFRSNVGAYSLLASAAKGLNYRLWSRQHVQVLKAVAGIPTVDRVFVNAHIKKELCRTAGADRAWLRKIRPWYHHDDHFHMRLTCPPDSPACIRQAPLPAGDGCDASLDWWFEPHPPGVKKAEEPKPALPGACRAVLNGG